MIKFLDLHDQYMSIKHEVDEAISNVISNTSFIGGEHLQTFEKEFADFQNSKFCLGVGNGTDALEIALEALNLPINSEIIVPANSFIASSEAVTRTGHKVVFCDVDKDDYTIDTTDVENKITKNTSAIIAVHLYGHPCNMDVIQNISKKFNLKIIEDASEALGSYYRGRHLGTFGQIGVISFNGNKIITTGGGGIVITNNKVLANKVRHLSNVAKIYKKHETEHDIVAFNYKMPNINAVLGIAQLENLKKFINFKRNLFIKYKKNLSKFKDIIVFKEPPNGKSNYWLQTLIINSNFKNLKKELFKFANKEGVAIRSAWTLMHKNKYLKRFPKMDLSNANKIQKLIINIPSSYFRN